MKIVIPSKGRGSVEQQTTLRRNFVQFKSQRPVTLVVPHDEARRYESNVRSLWPSTVEVVAAPPEVQGIAHTREWILTNFGGRVLMVDDDMYFFFRPSMNDVKLVPVTAELFENLLEQLEDWLASGLVHVGVSARQGNNTHPAQSGRDHISGFVKGDVLRGEIRHYRDATRMMNMYAYDTDALRKLPVEFRRVPVMEDFDLTLQLLRLGYPNRVAYNYVWNQGASGSSGGCSTYRTSEMQAAAARRLAELHPGFVRVTTKLSKASSSSWKGMKERVDVTVDWIKAFESAQKTDERRGA